jgi:hypothetical protein
VQPLVDGALADARKRGDTSAVALAAALRSLAGSAGQRTGDALADLAEAEASLRRLTDEQLAHRVYLGVYIGLAALRLEHLDDVPTHVHRCFRVARLTGQDTMAHPWLSITSCALVLKGEIAEARRDAAAAIDTTLLPGENWRTTWALEADAMAAFWAGDAQRALASATQMVGRSGGRWVSRAKLTARDGKAIIINTNQHTPGLFVPRTFNKAGRGPQSARSNLVVAQ